MIVNNFCSYGNPRIGIIGADKPTEPYTRNMGIKAGYFLRELVDNNNSVLFTGGMSGCGLDAYLGIALFCKEHNIKDDRFFVLFPDCDLKPAEGMYEKIAADLINAPINIVSSGSNFEERREILSQVADKLVVLNGGPGTLDEVIRGIQKNKPAYCLAGTGGAADWLINYKSSSLVREDLGLTNKNLIIPITQISEIKM